MTLRQAISISQFSIKVVILCKPCFNVFIYDFLRYGSEVIVPWTRLCWNCTSWIL